MNGSNRRIFLMQVAAGGTVLAAGAAHAQGAPMVNEKDAQPMALGYAADTTKVDAKKHPNWKAGNICGNCQFYQGKEAWGVCPLLGGKQVAAKGWCTAWAKKA